jgi:hypothetical protein
VAVLLVTSIGGPTGRQPCRTPMPSGAVDHSRARLKPEIPTRGENGINLRDELELEKWLGSEQGSEAF